MTSLPMTETPRLRVVLTAGGTREPIDDVRHVSNVAGGGLPAAMANDLLGRGADVHYIHGPGALLPGRVTFGAEVLGVDAHTLHVQLHTWMQQAQQSRAAWNAGTLTLHPIETAAQSAQVLASVVAQVKPDLVCCAMAVADFAPIVHAGKLPSRAGHGAGLSVQMQATAKAIDGVKRACPSCTLLGFKLLSGASEEALRRAATALSTRSGADYVFGNDIQDYRAGRRRGILFAKDGSVLGRPDGGQGAGAQERLAEALVAAVLSRL